MSQDLVSFVLRFVREAGEDQQARWRGVVKHVQTNTEESFGQFSEALIFMQDHVNEVIRTGFEESEQFAARANRENPFEESAKLWGNFMTPYAEMMTKSMDSVMEAATSSPLSKSMEDVMSSSMAFWGLASKQDETVKEETLEELLNQVTSLNEKVTDLEEQLRSAKAENNSTENTAEEA